MFEGFLGKKEENRISPKRPIATTGYRPFKDGFTYSDIPLKLNLNIGGKDRILDFKIGDSCFRLDPNGENYITGRIDRIEYSKEDGYKVHVDTESGNPWIIDYRGFQTAQILGIDQSGTGLIDK